MPLDGIELTQLSMNADKARLAAMSQNAANLNSIGYKQVRLDQLNLDPRRLGVAHNAGLMPQKIWQVTRNMAVGQLIQTRHPFDLALAGDGFLVVKSDQGSLYTRDGRLRLNKQGDLVTQSGQLIQGQQGLIHIGLQKFKVERDAVVWVADKAVDRLRIVTFGPSDELQPLGNGLYRSHSIPRLAPLVDVRQGFLEKSNVDQLAELTKMIALANHFRGSQRVLQAYDQILADTVK